MHPLSFLLLVFAYTAILWIVVVVLYNRFFEPFDFGNIGWFIGKSVILVFLVSLCGLHLIGILGSVIVWWLGLMFLFNKDFWECRILVLLLWGLFLASSVLITGYLIDRWDLSLELGLLLAYPPRRQRYSGSGGD